MKQRLTVQIEQKMNTSPTKSPHFKRRREIYVDTWISDKLCHIIFKATFLSGYQSGFCSTVNSWTEWYAIYVNVKRLRSILLALETIAFRSSGSGQGTRTVTSWESVQSRKLTHVGDGLSVGSSQTEVTNNLQAAVVRSQMQRSSAILVQRERENEGRSYLVKTVEKKGWKMWQYTINVDLIFNTFQENLKHDRKRHLRIWASYRL